MKRLKSYKIEGDVSELENIMNYNAIVIVRTSLKDILSVLTKDGTNYVKVGHGKSLIDAYKNSSLEGMVCKLMHIFYSDRSYMSCAELNEFILGLGDDIIFGYSLDERLKSGVKLVMLCQ